MLRMGDAIYVANLPVGLDAYAGYVDGSWPTFSSLAHVFPGRKYLSISVLGAPAMCADVESMALTSWAGFDYGYANASSVGNLIVQHGRPKKLWVAHYTNVAHICTSAQCWPSSPVPWQADGTQWTDHGGVWDESLLADNFFTLGGTMPSQALPAAALPVKQVSTIVVNGVLNVIMLGADGHVYQKIYAGGWEGPVDLAGPV